MERQEMGRWFGVMAQNYVWRLELPQEGARRWAETLREYGRQEDGFIAFLADLLQELSDRVRAEWHGAQEAIHLADLTETPEELRQGFGGLARQYLRMGELPQETARRWAETCRAHGVDYSRYIGYWAGLLLTLSRLVRAEGRGGSGSDPAPDRMQRQG